MVVFSKLHITVTYWRWWGLELLMFNSAQIQNRIPNAQFSGSAQQFKYLVVRGLWFP